MCDNDETSENAVIKLLPLQMFARDILILLNEAGGRMMMVNFEHAYLNRFGKELRSSFYYFKGRKDKKLHGDFCILILTPYFKLSQPY